MNNLNDPKSSQKVFLLTLLGILLVGLPLTILALQKQQIFRQFAWEASQSATAICSEEDGKAAIKVNFTNSEGTKSMSVSVKDVQTGATIALGTVKPGTTATDTIVTDKTELDAGSVIFTLNWTDGTSGTETRTAQYEKIASCTGGDTVDPPKLFCIDNPDINEGSCSWDKLDGASGYIVKVINTDSGVLIKEETLPESATELKFKMEPNVTYQCTVKATNVCGEGPESNTEKSCEPAPEPKPTEQPYCPTEPNKYGECSWDILDGADEYHVVVKEEESGKIVKEETVKNPTQKINFTAEPDKKYICTVIGKNECGESKPKDSPPISCVESTPTPQPSNTPMPSNTPAPTATPQPTPVPTATPQPTPAPTATPRPQPTPTPIIIVRTPQNIAPPAVVQQPPQVVQQPPQVVQQPPQVVQQPPQVVQQPPQVVQQPPQVVQQPPQVVQQPPVVQPGTPAPTMKPTGNLSNSLILVGTSTVLLIIGSVLFFLL